MDSPAREARVMAPVRDTDESRCPMALLPPETKMQIMSYISTQQSLSRLGQSCRAWYEVANEELYKRDSRENNSFAIKWMAFHAVDEGTTDSAIRTLETSRRWGGQIDAVNRFSQSDEARWDNEDRMMYDTSTALFVAVLLGNVRLAKTLLDMKASPTIPCPALFWRLPGSTGTTGSKELVRRFQYFLDILEVFDIGLVFPILLAFLQSDPDMCKLLLEHGAGREAMIVYSQGQSLMSILHFAAADPTTDYRQWQCLFDKFREYIDEPYLRESYSTPLHVALRAGCTQGMQIAVESGADKESKNGASHTPLSSLILEITRANQFGTFGSLERFTMCIRKFVELGASLDSDVDSLLLLAVQSYVLCPFYYPLTRQLIYFLLDHGADIHGTGGWQNTNMVNEIIGAIFRHEDPPEPQSLELLKELLSDLVNRGSNLAMPAPGLPSPLYRVLNDRKAKPEWLFDYLCENGATIHEHEVNAAFTRWSQIPRLWMTNKYNAWWQHQGQEDEIFLKWCEHPYNVWWWQHVKKISPHEVKQAYEVAFGHEDRYLYDILAHLPLPAPSDDALVKLAFDSESTQRWAWRLVVLMSSKTTSSLHGLPTAEKT